MGEAGAAREFDAGMVEIERARYSLDPPVAADHDEAVEVVAAPVDGDLVDDDEASASLCLRQLDGTGGASEVTDRAAARRLDDRLAVTALGIHVEHDHRLPRVHDAQAARGRVHEGQPVLLVALILVSRERYVVRDSRIRVERHEGLMDVAARVRVGRRARETETSLALEESAVLEPPHAAVAERGTSPEISVWFWNSRSGPRRIRKLRV